MNFYQNSNEKLKIKNITKSYQQLTVVEDVSFSLHENEFVSLLGPSGCGKSTIFNIVSGLLMPDGGEVYIEGNLSMGQPGRLGYMHQKDLLLPWKKIIENLCLPLIIKGVDKSIAEGEAKKYIDIFGLKGFEYKYPSQLSGGMRQRAALLRTYLFSSSFMLLDEPFGALDAITRTKMQNWLLTTAKKLNTAILFITHDIEEAILLSNRIYVLSQRPAIVKKEIKVNLPEERTKELITSSEFNNIKREILTYL